MQLGAIVLYPVRALLILIGLLLFVIAYLPHIILALPLMIPGVAGGLISSIVAVFIAIPLAIVWLVVNIGFGLMTLGWEGEFRAYQSPIQGPIDRRRAVLKTALSIMKLEQYRKKNFPR